MNEKKISLMTLRRLPVYLHYLNEIKNTCKSVSATIIADAFGLNDVQVRKDLAAVSGRGRPKTGYNTEELIKEIEICLNYGTETKTVLVGAGNLGKALLSYGGFADYGLNIIAAFDISPNSVSYNGKPILPLCDLEYVCRYKDIRLGIITVPTSSAQEICDRLVACGVKAIWNFASIILKAPKDVLIENENLASSLAIISRHIKTEDSI